MPLHIVAIGPLPPPVHGYSLVTAAMIELLSNDHTVLVENVAPSATGGRLARQWGKLARVARACATLSSQRRHAHRRCYLACDGGLGQVYTLLLLITARLLACPAFLHHHSFRYVEHETLLMRLIVTLAGPSLTHVFLSETMREHFAATYAHRLNGVVVSNAAFVLPQPGSSAPPRPLTIGLIGNLDRSKGLHVFMALVRRANADGLAIRAILAGPVADGADRAAIDDIRRELPDAVEYRGPVHGDAKTQFYADIDVFVFPTSYVHEAQPLVVFEAKAAGNAVIAYDRGCIRGQLEETDLLIGQDDDFVDVAIAWLSLCTNHATRQILRERVRQQYRITHARALEKAKSLMR